VIPTSVTANRRGPEMERSHSDFKRGTRQPGLWEEIGSRLSP